MARPKDLANMSLSEQAQAILKIARKHGVEQNFFFITTFKRYQVQISILNDLEKTIKNDGLTVSKEYVKGRKNVYSHPAIKDYNRTADAANKTVAVLLKIIHSMRHGSDGDDPEDPLMKVLAGGGLEDMPDPEDISLEDDDDDEEEDDDVDDTDEAENED